MAFIVTVAAVNDRAAPLEGYHNSLGEKAAVLEPQLSDDVALVLSAKIAAHKK